MVAPAGVLSAAAAEIQSATRHAQIATQRSEREAIFAGQKRSLGIDEGPFVVFLLFALAWLGAGVAAISLSIDPSRRGGIDVPIVVSWLAALGLPGLLMLYVRVRAETRRKRQLAFDALATLPTVFQGVRHDRGEQALGWLNRWWIARVPYTQFLFHPYFGGMSGVVAGFPVLMHFDPRDPEGMDPSLLVFLAMETGHLAAGSSAEATQALAADAVLRKRGFGRVADGLSREAWWTPRAREVETMLGAHGFTVKCMDGGLLALADKKTIRRFRKRPHEWVTTLGPVLQLLADAAVGIGGTRPAPLS